MRFSSESRGAPVTRAPNSPAYRLNAHGARLQVNSFRNDFVTFRQAARNQLASAIP
jgi:hypothetical protein